MHYAETKYGFEWASAKIQRIFSDKEKGWITLGIETPKFEGHKGLQVYITKTGKVRIFDSRGEWKQPNTGESMETKLEGRYCMVRTYSAGVFAGTVKEKDGEEIVLTDARRIWYWDGAASLSQLATSGTSKPENCKFPEPVAEVLLRGLIEIIPITEKARASIAAVPVWEK